MSINRENSRLTDRCQHLTQYRLKVQKDLSRYLKDFSTTKDYVEDMLQTQMNEIAFQFERQPKWMSLMFWEGRSPGLPIEKMQPDETSLVVSVDALQISLMLFRRLILTKHLSEDKWFKYWDRILPKDGGEERDVILQGCVAGMSDYVVVAACQEMQKVNSPKVRNCILAQYRASISQFYREQDILCKGPLDEEGLQQLRETWQSGQSVSAYYMGVVCADGDVDPGRDAILKEFEFWMSIHWLRNRMEEPDENLRCGNCYTDERLMELTESKNLTEEQRQLLCFCRNMPN